MPASLLDLIRETNEDLRDFLHRAREFPASPGLLTAVHVQSLTARLAGLGEALAAAPPESLADAHASPLYADYKELLSQIHSAIDPLHGQMLVRQVQLGMDRAHVTAARSWSQAFQRTR